MKKIILKLTGLKLVAAVFGLLYSILQVRFFGASGEVDAFFVASSTVYLITSLLQGGQLSEVFLPEYLKQKNSHSQKDAHLLLSAVLTRVFVFGVILLSILHLLAPFIINLIGAGLQEELKAISLDLFNIALPLILLTVISAFTNTTLNAEEVYGRAEFTGLISSIISTVLLVLFYKDMGVYILVYSLLVGKIIDLFITLYFLHKINFYFTWAWNIPNYDVNKFFKVLLTTSSYVLVTQLNVSLMTALSSYLPVGSISIYNYVKQLSSKASSILSSPINTVFFSKFSIYVSEKRKNLDLYMRSPLMAMMGIYFLMSCMIYLIGEEILKILWSDKQLTTDELFISYVMLSLNFIGLIFTNTGQVFRKAAVAYGKANRLYRGWTVIQLFSISYTFVSIYYFGIYGLITFPIINTMLMSSVCFYVANKTGIKVMTLFRDLFLNKSFFGFTFIILIATLSIDLFDNWNIGAFKSAILKSLALLIFILVASFVFYPKFITQFFKRSK